MPVINRIASFAGDMTEWRRWMHRHPELGFDLPKTSTFVAKRLRDMGVDEVHEGIAESGIVAVIKGATPGPTVALRADMDALPIAEETGAAWASTHPGRMHACGHDGHTTMLLGAARYLAETRAFRGQVVLFFQPAEEDGGGGRVMVEEGVMERFEVHEVYALHNAPGLPFGEFGTRPGPIMAAVDEFNFEITGRGGHAALPHHCADPIPPAMALAQGLDTIVSRNRPGTAPLIVSVTQIHAGIVNNVIPGRAKMSGTVRAFSEELRDLAEARIRDLSAGIAAAYGVDISLDYQRHYPPTVNDTVRAGFAADVAREIVGADMVTDDLSAEMGSEDFAYMLDARPGAYLFIGQGTEAGLHHPLYDFNDDIAPIGASFFARLVERALPLDG